MMGPEMPVEEIVSVTREMLYLVIIISGLIQMLKRLPLPEIAKSFYPLGGLVVGVLGSYYMGLDNYLLSGIMCGLLATGGYEILKLPTQ
ncbi:MAG: hypothetical protein KOO60_07500 [Gemmatimonadales bacterium]|nr:hypothetical protein [Gemmatimonadales bacterium]